MTLKWRARVTWAACLGAFVAALVALGEATIREHPLYLALVLLPPLVAFLAAWLDFRCPHCGARAVTGHYGYWVVSDTCSHCLHAFGGPHLSDDELAEELTSRTDPALAKQLRTERLEEMDLRSRAPHDPAAAAALEGRLRKRLVGVEAWVEDMRRHFADGRAEAQEVRTAEAALKELDSQLAWCRSLPRSK